MKRAAFGVAVAIALPAAAAPNDGRFYVGISAGTSHADSDFAEQVRQGRALDLKPPYNISLANDARTVSRLFAGIHLDSHFSVEADWTDLAALHSSATTFSMPVVEERVLRRTNISTRAASLSLVGTWPVTGEWAALGRVGGAWTRTQYHTQLDGYYVPPGGSEDNGVTAIGPSVYGDHTTRQVRPIAALGMEWRPQGRWSVRAEWTHYWNLGEPFGQPGVYSDRGKFDLDTLMLGVMYRF